MNKVPHIEVKDLVCAYGDYLVLRDISFEIKRAEILVIMGRSGCGKSTLLKHMIGLREPAEGKVYYDGKDFTSSSEAERESMLRKFGILYQGGALWSSMTLEENVAFPLEEYTDLKRSQIHDIVEMKLSQVGLKGFQKFYPSELSGGMRKRAGLARAMALDPEILFFDEPTSGLDPISSLPRLTFDVNYLETGIEGSIFNDSDFQLRYIRENLIKILRLKKIRL